MYDKVKVCKRNGNVVSFTTTRIEMALRNAFLETQNPLAENEALLRKITNKITNDLFNEKNLDDELILDIRDIQDRTELVLYRDGFDAEAKAFSDYRVKKDMKRKEDIKTFLNNDVKITNDAGELVLLDIVYLAEMINRGCKDLDNVNPNELLHHTNNYIYTGITFDEILDILILASREKIEEEPNYAKVAARFLMMQLHKTCFGKFQNGYLQKTYVEFFNKSLHTGINAKLLNPKMASQFDLVKLGKALKPERDDLFEYLGLKTLYDRYFIKVNKKQIEMPQTFFMRVAMGLALKEDSPTERAIEFYNMLSTFRFMSSTPTLFNSGTRRSQLSSCYLSTVEDSIDGIFKAYADDAKLSKYAGGLGNDWTPVRASGSHVVGTNGYTNGIVPYLKIANDTAVAVNQGGKRKGALCVYLESWHLDIEQFLELRKNTGDDRIRCHDINTANWIPDLFMERVKAEAEWTLFSPVDVPELHDLYGEEFKVAYEKREKEFDEGNLRGRRVKSYDLWKKMLTMLFGTGHAWMTFKDACNIRSPQKHTGVVHSSNLCTEITLNTNKKEVAVCNLGSVNLKEHLIKNDKEIAIDKRKLKETIRCAMRMLDNVIDINFYPIPEAKHANMLHRPVGLGIMGFQDCLYELGINYDSKEAVKFADETMEKVCYFAYDASTDLAGERGKYKSYEGSDWSKGILPHHTYKNLAESGRTLIDEVKENMDWTMLLRKIKKNGMRNSNCVAIAPTATIANIVGVTASIEPTFQNIFVKSNLSGEFTVINKYLVAELKRLGLWDKKIREDLSFYDGKWDNINYIPEDIKRKFKMVYDIEPTWLIQCGAARQKWIDQAQSLNLYIPVPSGPLLHSTYMEAYDRGLKTTYYLRTPSASTRDKSTTRTGALSGVSAHPTQAPACNLDGECESCQ